MDEIFGPWPEKYDQWFQTPLGRLVEEYEGHLILTLLEPGQKGHLIFRHVFFRSPVELAGLSPVESTVETAIHFQKTDEPNVAKTIEREARERGMSTGAFVSARWIKPQ